MLWRFPTALLLLAGAVPLILFLQSLKPRGLQVRTATIVYLGAGFERASARHPARLALAEKPAADPATLGGALAHRRARRSVAALLRRRGRRLGRGHRPERQHEGAGARCGALRRGAARVAVADRRARRRTEDDGHRRRGRSRACSCLSPPIRAGCASWRAAWKRPTRRGG